MPALLEDPARCRHASPSGHLRALRRGSGLSGAGDGAVLRAAILARIARLRPGTSCCPSEIARDLSDDWRPLMAQVRAEGFRLAAEGSLAVTQRGRVVGPEARGPVRLTRAKNGPR